jgi:hypothetical protein
MLFDTDKIYVIAPDYNLSPTSANRFHCKIVM